jgi:MoxR-like ATPase
MPEMHKDSTVIFGVFFKSMILAADVRLVEKAQHFLFELPTAFARDDLYQFDFAIDRVFDDAVELRIDLSTTVVNVMQVQFEFRHELDPNTDAALMIFLSAGRIRSGRIAMTLSELKRFFMSMQAEEFRQLAEQIEQEIGKVIVGQHRVVRHVLISILAGGHVLLEGVPGLGKTMLIRTLGDVLRLKFSRIQFTPDLMPADIIGTDILVDQNGQREFRFQAGPIFANLVLADEINRATPKTQSALLEAMQEYTVTVAQDTYKLDQPFFVLATQNPLEMEGTYPLPEAQLDRFFFKVDVRFPSAEELVEILNRTTGAETQKAENAVDAEQIMAMRSLARQVPIASHVSEYAARLTVASHPDHPDAPPLVKQFVRYGASPRAGQAMILGAKVSALLAGRYNVAFEDLQGVAPAALRHRLLLNFEGLAEGVSPDDIVAELINTLPTTA